MRFVICLCDCCVAAVCMVLLVVALFVLLLLHVCARPSAAAASFVCLVAFDFFFPLSQILWTFSVYLESVAIVPQLFMVHSVARESGGFVEALTADYVFTLGGYRVLYLLNWLYRLATENHYRNWIVWIAGIVQTAIYGDFFYYYAKARWSGQKMSLPI